MRLLLGLLLTINAKADVPVEYHCQPCDKYGGGEFTPAGKLTHVKLFINSA